MANTELKRTISSAGSQTKWGASAWVKLLGAGTLNDTQAVYCSSKSDTTANLRGIMINSDYEIQVAFYDSGYSFQVETNRKLRDPSGFYHICVEFDSSQSTADDRIKIWVNGVRETSMATNSQPSHNGTYNFFGTDITQLVGSLREGSTICNPCVISHLHVTDGYCYPASSYGETDATTGEWKIKTSPSVSYGTNGFFVLKDDAALTDRSGQGNDLTLGSGTLTKTEDCPSNNFATMNTLGTYDGSMANGNTSVTTDQTNYRYIASTLGVNKGKWYWEVKLKTQANYMLCGITDQPSFPASGITMLGNGTYDCAVYTGDLTVGGGNGHLYHSSTSNASGTNTPGAFMGGLGTNDIITFALDLDSATKKLYIGVGGNWANGSGSTNQTFANASGVTIVAPSSTNTGFYFPACGDYSGTNGTFEYNFGNGYFGTTQVSSAGTNASNLGIFELDVPSGYTALCTKGLNE